MYESKFRLIHILFLYLLYSRNFLIIVNTNMNKTANPCSNRFFTKEANYYWIYYSKTHYYN